MHVEGTVLCGRSFEPVEGRVVVEDGEIVAVEEAATDSDAIVCPAFVNAHTHIGDSIAKEAGGGLSLDDLVAPPDGLKHRLLRDASTEETVAAMRRSLRFMERSGTAAAIEFREMEFAAKVGGVDAHDVLRMATVHGADLVGLNCGLIEPGRAAKLLVLDGDSDNLSGVRDPVRAVVRRAGVDDVARVVL